MEIPNRFIVVDDDPSSNLLCSYAIKRIFPGMDVRLYENPVSALEIIKEEYSNPSHNVATVLLLDINMPEVSGWDFINEFKDFSDHLHKQFSIYILTSSVSKSDREVSTLLPFISGYFTKPLNGDWVRETFSTDLSAGKISARPLPCYRITKNSLGVYRFKLLDKKEGKILIRSAESFATQEDCKKSISLCQASITSEKSYVRLHHGRNFFRVLDRENRIVGISEMFTTSYEREVAIKTTKQDGTTANIEEDATYNVKPNAV